MMRLRPFLLATLLVAGLAAAQDNGHPPQKHPPVVVQPKPLPPGAPAPKIACPKPTFEFGEVSQGEEVVHDFEIENVGKGELEILSIEKTCGCTHAAAQKDRLQPGEKTLVNAKLNTAGKQGPLTLAISVKSNDPEKPTLQLTFQGKVSMPFSASVTEVNFGTLVKGAVVPPKTFDIVNTSTQSITEIKTDNEQVKAVYELIPPDAKKQGYRVTVHIEGPPPVGALRSTVSIGTTLAAQKVITIPVLATVEGEITVKPRTSNFGKIKRGDPVTRTVEITKAGHPDLKIENVEIKPDGLFTFKLEEVSAGKTYRIVLGIAPNAKDGYSRGTVTMKTNCPGETDLQLYAYALLE